MRVAMLDDSGLFRAALRLLLTTSGVEVISDVATAAELLAVVLSSPPDVVILDVSLNSRQRDEEGLHVAEQLHTLAPTVGLLVLSTYDETPYATRLLQIRDTGVGYLLKDRVEAPDMLLDALDRVHAGQTAIDVDIVGRLVRHRRTSGALESLTTREQDVLRLIAEGRSNVGIGETLVLSPRTVEAHIASAFAKLGLPATEQDNRRVLAALSWLRAGRTILS